MPSSSLQSRWSSSRSARWPMEHRPLWSARLSGTLCLITFTMQMAFVAIGGYVVASSEPAARLINRLAGWPKTGVSAIGMVATVSRLASLLNWGLSLNFSGLLVLALAKRRELKMAPPAFRAQQYWFPPTVVLVGLWHFRSSTSGGCPMRNLKRTLWTALVVAVPLLVVGTAPASAWGCYGYRGCGHNYYAPRVYGYTYYRPAYFYRSYYRRSFAYGGFYRPRVWGWHGWHGRGWGWRRW
jgi:Short chain fatty acid transporter